MLCVGAEVAGTRFIVVLVVRSCCYVSGAWNNSKAIYRESKCDVVVLAVRALALSSQNHLITTSYSFPVLK